jgi:hypothetical protein
VFVILQETGAGDPLVMLLPIATTFVLRLAAIRYDLHVPPFRPKDSQS